MEGNNQLPYCTRAPRWRRSMLVAALVSVLVAASSGLVATTTGGLPPLPTGQQLQLATLDFDDAGVGGYARHAQTPD